MVERLLKLFGYLPAAVIVVMAGYSVFFVLIVISWLAIWRQEVWCIVFNLNTGK